MKIDKRFMIVIFIILLLWASLFWYMVKYGKYVRDDPCSVCAEKHGEMVFCALGGEKLTTRIYCPSGEIEEEESLLGLIMNNLSTEEIKFEDT